MRKQNNGNEMAEAEINAELGLKFYLELNILFVHFLIAKYNKNHTMKDHLERYILKLFSKQDECHWYETFLKYDQDIYFIPPF